MCNKYAFILIFTKTLRCIQVYDFADSAHSLCMYSRYSLTTFRIWSDILIFYYMWLRKRQMNDHNSLFLLFCFSLIFTFAFISLVFLRWLCSLQSWWRWLRWRWRGWWGRRPKWTEISRRVKFPGMSVPYLNTIGFRINSWIYFQ